MAKPKKWDTMTTEEQDAWKEKQREYDRKYRTANPEKERERARKWQAANPEKTRERHRKYREANTEKERERIRKLRHKSAQQSAADQFFIMAGAATELSKLSR